MERYINTKAALKIIDSYGRTVTEDAKVVVAAIRDIVEVITPTADVAPKSEVDNWYQLYHSIKEELKQEKTHHRETENLCDRYYIESQQAKRQVAREIFAEMDILGTYNPTLYDELKKKYVGD